MVAVEGPQIQRKLRLEAREVKQVQMVAVEGPQMQRKLLLEAREVQAV